MYRAAKKKVHQLLHPELGQNKFVRFVNGFIIVLIVLNVAAVMLETVPSIHDPYKDFFHAFDVASVVIFTIEYVLRVWSINQVAPFKHPVYGRLRYMFTAGALIDLLAILPFYIHRIVGLDLRVLRVLRLMRFLRLFRLTAFTRSAKLVRSVFRTRANDLKISFVIIIFLIIVASCLVFFAENHAQPEKFSSIPATFWWAIVTVTSVGYGDMVPITMIGKVLSSFISLIGLAVFALPAGIITAGFLEEMRKAKGHHTKNCPHCGQPIE